MADDLPLAKKVAASVKKDLEEQLHYYHSLGDEQVNEEQMVATAYNLLQGKGGEMRRDRFHSRLILSVHGSCFSKWDGWRKDNRKFYNTIKLDRVIGTVFSQRSGFFNPACHG